MFSRSTKGLPVRLPLIAALALAGTLGGCQMQSVPALEDQAEYATTRGELETAEEKYRQALSISPGRVQSRVGLGKTLLAMGRPEEARRELEIALAARPNDTEILELVADAMVQSGELDKMYRLLRGRANELNTVDDWIRLGRFAGLAGDADVAENALLTAARLDRGLNPEPQIALANFYDSIGDDARALRRLRMAIFLDPANVELQTRIRALGETPGPTFAIPPEERRQG